MKKLAIPALALTCVAAALAQIHYQDRAGNLEWKATSLSGSPPVGNGPFTVLLKGNPVYVRSAAQGLEVYGTGVVTVRAAPSPKKKGTYILEGLNVTGSVRAVQSVGGHTTEIRGSSGRYSGDAAQGKLELAGPVRITDTDAVKHRNLVATGSQGFATLDPTPAVGKSALRAATLEGDVAIDVRQAPQPGETQPSMFHATGSHLVIDNVSTPATAVLSGNVKMSGEGNGPLNANIEGVQKAVITLNERGEMTKIDLSSEPGSLTTTRVRGLGKRGGG